MSNYYEQLNVSPMATTDEIQTAIDTHYNQWRHNVTHPDATIVEEANRNLRVLEHMRATLTDPAKRAGYDAGIGLGGAAGLADPMAVMHQTAPPPPRPQKATGQSYGAASGLWACPKCATDNPPQTKHCFKCGTQLVRNCPNCDQMTSLVASGFCGNCGANYDLAVRMAELRVAKEATSAQESQARSAVHQTMASLNGLTKPRSSMVISKALIGAVGGLGTYWSLGLLGFSSGSRLLFAIVFALFGLAIGLMEYGKAKSAYDKTNARLQQDLAAKQGELARASEQLAAIESELEIVERRLKP